MLLNPRLSLRRNLGGSWQGDCTNSKRRQGFCNPRGVRAVICFPFFKLYGLVKELP